MDIYDGFETVKQKLIIAGMQEIENHGVGDFSLRRVASLCNVSCAAPYKHFKSKEDFISEIALYIHKQWHLLQNQVSELFSDNPKKELIEICISYVKFWIANPNFHSVLMLKPQSVGSFGYNIMSEITDKISSLLDLLWENNDDFNKTTAVFAIRSILYGATAMIDNGELENSDHTINMIRASIEKQL
ncbi:MAG: TetR/AcrR family transcriptional regulator [Clostridia bacterium]|nr:TetR/AcrR family transcriptional regulator [Clostridia bacterium]